MRTSGMGARLTTVSDTVVEDHWIYSFSMRFQNTIGPNGILFVSLRNGANDFPANEKIDLIRIYKLSEQEPRNVPKARTSRRFIIYAIPLSFKQPSVLRYIKSVVDRHARTISSTYRRASPAVSYPKTMYQVISIGSIPLRNLPPLPFRFRCFRYFFLPCPEY